MAKNGKPSKKPSNAIETKTGGYLIPGRGGGPQPGSGRPPSAVRAKLRDLVDGHGIDVLLEAMTEDNVTRSDRLKAVDIAGKYGLSQVNVDEALIQTLADHVSAVVRPMEGGEEALQRIRDLWVPELKKRL